MEKIHQEIQNHRNEELYMLINAIKIVSNHENMHRVARLYDVPDSKDG
jgi:hypothetical protein